MMDVETTDLVVRKEVRVPLSREAAFRLFTEGAGKWWPLKSHSVGGELAVTCKIEGKVGGRFYEIVGDGSEVEWGTVLAWEPPGRLVFSWHPGYDPGQAQEVEVTFVPEAGGSRLTLVHRGWERREKDQEKFREGYDTGWDFVLGRYLAAALPDRA